MQTPPARQPTPPSPPIGSPPLPQTQVQTLTVQQLREQVVTCTRLLVFKGILDYSGHVSARIPGTERMLLQPRDASRAGLDAEDLLVVDFEGAVVEGDGLPVVEWPIHAGAALRLPPTGRTVHSSRLDAHRQPGPGRRTGEHAGFGARVPDPGTRHSSCRSPHRGAVHGLPRLLGECSDPPAGCDARADPADRA